MVLCFFAQGAFLFSLQAQSFLPILASVKNKSQIFGLDVINGHKYMHNFSQKPVYDEQVVASNIEFLNGQKYIGVDIAESARGKDEANPVFSLAIRAMKATLEVSKMP